MLYIFLLYHIGAGEKKEEQNSVNIYKQRIAKWINKKLERMGKGLCNNLKKILD